MNRKSRTTIFCSASVLLHVIGIFLVVCFLNPERQLSVDDAVSLRFFDINKPRIERTPTNTKRMAPIRKGMGGSPAQPNLAIRPIQQAIAASHNHLPTVDIGEENIGLGHRIGTGDGDGLNGRSFLAEPVERSTPVSVQTRKGFQTSGDVLPPNRTKMNRPIQPFGKDISLTELSDDPIDVDRDKIADRDKVDVVFIISARRAMKKYLGYVTSLVEREIQHYKKSGKDYHVGIMRSGFRLGNEKWIHQIEYLPLNSDIDTTLEIAQKTEVREDASDILLNTVRYALDRCVFRPNATRRIIVIGNDIPICGGYSPLNIIELCRKKQVRLDIHGADKQVGPLLAHETGGRWYPALENADDLRGLESEYHSSPHWKIRITLDTVVEVELGNRRKNR